MMWRLESRHLAVAVLASALLPALAVSQEVPASQESAPKSLTKKEARKREQKLSKELGPAYTN
jgi:hypothetical protein